MIRTLLQYCFIISVFSTAQAQNWTWAETAGGTLPDEANGCTMDEAGNMYMSGFYFSSSINFGNGNSLSNNGLSDGFVVKYNANGSAQWASKVKGPLEDKTTKCAVDRFGNVFATGYYDSPSIQFGGNNSHNISNSDNNGGTFDCFIVKYNSSGTPQWFYSIGQTDDDGGSNVATDSTGNVYVTGWFRAPSIPAGNFTLFNEDPNGGTSDMFLIKYDPNGNVLWAKSAGSLDDDKSRGCIVDPSGNIIVTGYLKGDSINIEGNYYYNSGSKDGFVIKYDSNGNLLAAKTLGGSSSEEPFECSVDTKGNIYLTGNYSSSSFTIDTVNLSNNGSGSGAFLLKLDPSLTALWARAASSSSSDEARGCSTDKFGNTVITGVFSGNSITFGSTVLNNNGGDEIFIVKYDTDGNMFWARKVGKSNDDGANDCFIDNNGRVLIAGYFNSSSIRFGNIDRDNSYVIVATSDVCIAHTCDAASSIDVVSTCDEYIWIDGITYTSSNNSAVFNYPEGASNSCDSMVLLDLTINTVDISVTDAAPNLTANSVNATYRWMDCNNNFSLLPGDTAQTFTATKNGTYAVEITKNGCVDTSACYTVNNISVGLEENKILESLSVYPNPCNGQVNIVFDNAYEQLNLTVRNVLGQEVFTSNYTNLKSELLDISTEKAGVYFLEIRTNSNQFAIIKLLKQ